MKARNSHREKAVIGRRDKVDFPELGLCEVDAKIDTGAYTSALHCHNMILFLKDGAEFVTFNLLDTAGGVYHEKELTLPVFCHRMIKNSFGQKEERIIIKTIVTVFRRRIRTEFSLSDRSDMKHPVLLGRRFLKGKFIVDVNRQHVSFGQKQAAK